MTQPNCELCGQPMPAGEEMFKFHGYSGPCPAPPKQPEPSPALPPSPLKSLRDYVQHKGNCKKGRCKRCDLAVSNHANLFHMGYGACCDKNDSTEAHGCTCGLDALLAAEATERERTWQPIETAPKDGTVILVYQPGGAGASPGHHFRASRLHAPSPIVTAYWHTPGNPQARGYWCARAANVYEPTHWMPLPEPPK